MDKTHPLALPGKPRPYVIAHRGNQVACPENTVAAFKRALTEGADILETDVHVTADGAFMCIHDATVDRTTNGSGQIAEMTLKEVKALSAACRRPGFEAERIPTVAEAAALITNNAAIALELKTDSFLETTVCQRLIAELEETGVRNRTIFLSFSLNRLRALREMAPDIPIGWITMSRLWPLGEPQLLGPVWPLLLINPLYVRLAHAHGQLVCPLDPTPESRLRLYQWLGCDALLTNDPGKTIRALKRRHTPCP
ncbi:MAG: hypothetical protein FJZ95_02630 [Chloroflexi bacterium]|nr:hypothetical protein [Chloroflexota bacterium]